MNKRDTDLLDMLPALEDGSLMYTPISICRDMVNLIPDDVFNKDAKFLDIACKSGRFLREIMYRLMESKQMQSGSAEGRDEKKYNLAIESERKEYIMREQLFGLSLNDTVVNIARRNLYGTLDSGIDNIIVLKENVRRTLKEKFGDMQFDVVVGNPPYNNDLYLDFVKLGHSLAHKYDCWITPAKWQAKGGDKNKQFREEIVPYMSKIVYYPDCLDVFAIADSCGICYYIIDKDIHDECEVTNKSSIRSDLNSVQKREILRKQSLWNVGNSIVEHIGQVNSFKVGDVQKRKKYTVSINTQSSIMRGFAIKEQDDNGKWRIRQDLVGKGGAIFDKDGKVVVLGKISILAENGENVSGTSKCIFTSDNAEEVKSFLSYIQSKLVSFLVFIGINGLTIMNDETWRFVPEPEAFDHIFTDQELYEKYQLTDEEINIIESVIKERK